MIKAFRILAVSAVFFLGLSSSSAVAVEFKFPFRKKEENKIPYTLFKKDDFQISIPGDWQTGSGFDKGTRQYLDYLPPRIKFQVENNLIFRIFKPSSSGRCDILISKFESFQPSSIEEIYKATEEELRRTYNLSSYQYSLSLITLGERKCLKMEFPKPPQAEADFELVIYELVAGKDWWFLAVISRGDVRTEYADVIRTIINSFEILIR